MSSFPSIACAPAPDDRTAAVSRLNDDLRCLGMGGKLAVTTRVPTVMLASGY